MIKQKDNLLIFVGEFDREIKHSHLGIIRRKTLSYEFYWLDGWFNVFRFHEPNGDFRNFYCNLQIPPEFENDTLNYVDLDIDVLVWKDFSVEILDVEEFMENCQKYNYSTEIQQQTRLNLKKLLKLIENREFPFDIKT